jgi:hypothetical protein
MFYVYIFIVVVNLFSDQSMERQTEPGTIYIGNTELTNKYTHKTCDTTIKTQNT